MSDAPADPKKREQLKAMIAEMTHCLSRIDGEREQMKEIASAAAETFGLEKKMINKVARTMYKSNYASLQQENEEFEQLYESITGQSA
jgi:hypothetical protein